jgi:hypothetical protein
VLFVFFILRHDRRRVVHFNVTEHPSARWTAQQIVEAFPEDTAPFPRGCGQGGTLSAEAKWSCFWDSQRLW